MPRLIDADKVAEAIDWLNEYDFVLWHDVMECIDKVPTVDAEPVRHGHWITFGSMHRCSVCDETVLVPTTIVGTPIYDYCPHCGAIMDEEEENAKTN